MLRGYAVVGNASHIIYNLMDEVDDVEEAASQERRERGGEAPANR